MGADAGLHAMLHSLPVHLSRHSLQLTPADCHALLEMLVPCEQLQLLRPGLSWGGHQRVWQPAGWQLGHQRQRAAAAASAVPGCAPLLLRAWLPAAAAGKHTCNTMSDISHFGTSRGTRLYSGRMSAQLLLMASSAVRGEPSVEQVLTSARTWAARCSGGRCEHRRPHAGLPCPGKPVKQGHDLDLHSWHGLRWTWVMYG